MTQLNIKRKALRKPNLKRRKSCPFAAPNTPEIDYKDLKVLTRYVSERGKHKKHETGWRPKYAQIEVVVKK